MEQRIALHAVLICQVVLLFLLGVLSMSWLAQVVAAASLAATTVLGIRLVKATRGAEANVHATLAVAGIALTALIVIYGWP